MNIAEATIIIVLLPTCGFLAGLVSYKPLTRAYANFQADAKKEQKVQDVVDRAIERDNDNVFR